jgi:hypothetical protein
LLSLLVAARGSWLLQLPFLGHAESWAEPLAAAAAGATAAAAAARSVAATSVNTQATHMEACRTNEHSDEVARQLRAWP